MHDPNNRLVFVSQHLHLFTNQHALWQAPPPPDAFITPPQTHTPKQHTTLHHAIQHTLTDKQRQAIHLFFFCGLSQSEIARQLGVSSQVIQRRLFGCIRNGKRIGGAIARLRTALTHPDLPQKSI